MGHAGLAGLSLTLPSQSAEGSFKNDCVAGLQIATRTVPAGGRTRPGLRPPVAAVKPPAIGGRSHVDQQSHPNQAKLDEQDCARQPTAGSQPALEQFEGARHPLLHEGWENSPVRTGIAGDVASPATKVRLSSEPNIKALEGRRRKRGVELIATPVTVAPP